MTWSVWQNSIENRTYKSATQASSLCRNCRAIRNDAEIYQRASPSYIANEMAIPSTFCYALSQGNPFYQNRNNKKTSAGKAWSHSQPTVIRAQQEGVVSPTSSHESNTEARFNDSHLSLIKSQITHYLELEIVRDLSSVHIFLLLQN